MPITISNEMTATRAYLHYRKLSDIGIPISSNMLQVSILNLLDVPQVSVKVWLGRGILATRPVSKKKPVKILFLLCPDLSPVLVTTRSPTRSAVLHTIFPSLILALWSAHSSSTHTHKKSQPITLESPNISDVKFSMPPSEQLNMTPCTGPCCPSMNEQKSGAYSLSLFPHEEDRSNKLPSYIRDLLFRIHSNEWATPQSTISNTMKRSLSSRWLIRARARN